MVDGVGPGAVIAGRYTLSRPLGAGGFGQVWRAHDALLGVEVAVKRVLLDSGLPREERALLLARAGREARHAARLRDHPNIVTVYDVIEVEEVPWIVMQLVDGYSLADELTAQGPLAVGRASQVAEALLQALDAAHRADVMHRDVKPANVLLTAEGQVLLADFGIAVGRADTRLTASAMVIGSPGYMAPERWRGVEADGRADLFSLGVTLYEAVEGQPPFPRSNPTAALTDPPRPPRHAGRLAPLITALLEKDPAQRPTAAQALAMLGSAPDVGSTRIATAEVVSPGECTQLYKGSRLRLSHRVPAGASVLVELGWSARTLSEAHMEIDASALMVGIDGKVLDQLHFVFFNNPRSPERAVEHLTAGREQGSELIEINLTAVPAQIARILLVASVYDEGGRRRPRQSFGNLGHLCARILDQTGNQEIGRYEFAEEVSTEHSVIFGEIYRHDRGWAFQAVCRGYASGLRGIALDHGVNV